MENINGIQILEQATYYSTYPIAIFALIFIGGILFIIGHICSKESNYILGAIIIAISLFGCIIICEWSSPAFFTYPKKTIYTVEIVDDNAWKEIAPKYTVVKKLYESKEIYYIEEDY